MNTEQEHGNRDATRKDENGTESTSDTSFIADTSNKENQENQRLDPQNSI